MKPSETTEMLENQKMFGKPKSVWTKLKMLARRSENVRKSKKYWTEI